MIHVRKVIKVGNSLAVCFPKILLRKLGINEGDFVELRPKSPDGIQCISVYAIYKPQQKVMVL